MKIAIVKKSNNKVQTTYEADSIDMTRFGGPWGDPLQCEHVKIPQELEFEDPFTLEPYNGEEQVSTQTIRDGDEPAFNAARQPLKNVLGQPLMIPKYIEVPVMEARRLMRKK
jgi:hypothetical protein